MSDSILKMDKRWTPFLYAESQEIFNNKIVPEIQFNPKVPQDVVKSFKVIHNLTLHSYYEYEFYDVAAVKALMTFEMALVIRYKELTGKIFKGTLEKLINWFKERNYFEVLNDDFLNHLRKVRNLFAHPDQHSFGGGFMKQWIDHSVDLINDLYEDPVERKIRIDNMKEFQYKLNEINWKNAVIETKAGQILFYDIHIVFIDTKQPIHVIYLTVCPLFEIVGNARMDYSKTVNYEIFTFATTELRFEQYSVSFFDLIKGQNCKIKVAGNEENIEIQEWKKNAIVDPLKYSSTGFIHAEVSSNYNEFRRRYHRNIEKED